MSSSWPDASLAPKARLILLGPQTPFFPDWLLNVIDPHAWSPSQLATFMALRKLILPALMKKHPLLPLANTHRLLSDANACSSTDQAPGEHLSLFSASTTR